MIHLGDITKIDGAAAPPVNVVIGGSPCQDLSVAGKRAGLAGERSGLFMEQIRIIKEARKADAQRGRTGKDIRPRWMVWENVPGAFSSNKGADFGAVLHETIRVVCQEAPAVPMPKLGWPLAGCLYGEGGAWSVAWRVFDAQFWGRTVLDRDSGAVLHLGTPQRRRRIALVADFGGLTAPEILFERKSVSGDFEESGETRQGSPGDVEDRTGADDSKGGELHDGGVALIDSVGGQSERGWVGYTAPTLKATHYKCPPPDCVCGGLQGRERREGQRHRVGAGNFTDNNSVTQRDEPGPDRVYCWDARGNGGGTVTPTLTGDHENRITDYTTVLVRTYQDVTGPLMANSHPGSYTGQDAFSDMLVAGPAVIPIHDKATRWQGGGTNSKQ